MKIIKHGNKRTMNRRIICDLCGCEFEYSDNDVVIDKSFCFTTFPPTYKTYIKCPECDKAICLGTMIIN